tara:strand:+ start:719 stop:1018 length:300 start_codon:yes stop_codon:yes gene_type:complete
MKPFDNRIKTLLQLVKESSFKSKKKFLTFEGSEVDIGSQAHVDSYDQVLNELKVIRKQLSRLDRKEQDRITRCMESLRHLRRKAHSRGINTGLIKEIED